MTENANKTTSLRLSLFRIGLIIGLFCNGIFVIKALPYVFLPMGSVVGPDKFLNQIYPYTILLSVFIGIPIAIWEAVRYRGTRFNLLITIASVALCLITFQTPLKLQKVIGEARQIKTPCYPCDGPSPMEGLYFVY